MEKVLNCKWILGLVGLVIGFLAMWQEHTLGTGNAWILSLAIPAIGGAFVEVMNKVIYGNKYNIFNVLSWIVGGALAIVLAIIVF